MARRKAKGLMPVFAKKARKRTTKLPQSIYDSRAGISKTERNLEYEQAQSFRWLKQHVRGSQSIAAATQSELQAFFNCRTMEQIEARPELTVESKAILKILEAERERSRTVQGGVANPNDWFLTPTEENILASLMSNATLNETGDVEPKKSERSKVEQAVADFEEQEARDKSAKAERRLKQQPQNDSQEKRRALKKRRRMERREEKRSQAEQQRKGKKSYERQQPQNDPQETWKERLKMLRREKRTQAEQQRKEKESYDRQHHVELDRTGYPSATGPVIRNVQHLVRQRWLGGRDPEHFGLPRRSARLRHQEEKKQASELEMGQAAKMLAKLDISMGGNEPE